MGITGITWYNYPDDYGYIDEYMGGVVLPDISWIMMITCLLFRAHRQSQFRRFRKELRLLSSELGAQCLGLLMVLSL